MLSTAVKQISAFIGLITLIVLLIAIGPLVAIWSLNTLFAIGISYSFTSWFAMFCLLAVLRGSFLKVEK